MATIKSFTDISQSKKLAEILPLESADMYYISGDECAICFGNGVYEEIADWLSDGISRPADIPCWSLASLFNILPDMTCVYKKTYKDGKIKYQGVARRIKELILKDNPVDTCYELILKLHELNLL